LKIKFQNSGLNVGLYFKHVRSFASRPFRTTKNIIETSLLNPNYTIFFCPKIFLSIPLIGQAALAPPLAGQSQLAKILHLCLVPLANCVLAWLGYPLTQSLLYRPAQEICSLVKLLACQRQF
jgi:hypothetical protein